MPGATSPAVTRKSQLLEFSNALSNSRGCGLSVLLFSVSSASQADMAEFIRRPEVAMTVTPPAWQPGSA